MAAKWTMLILTCQNKNSAQAFQKELDLRQKKNLINENVILLAIEDPKDKVGSGGATLNALLIAAEHLSARQNYSIITSDVLHNAYILIMHQGRSFPFDSCGRAFVTLQDTPSYKGLKCNIDVLLDILTNKLAVLAPPGVWICSTDMFLDFSNCSVLEWNNAPDACMISMLGSINYAKNHGVLKLSKSGEVEDIFYCAEVDDIEKCVVKEDSVPLVSGIVYLSQKVSESLLTLQNHSPLNCCTYLGVDSGEHCLQLSLFFDILLAMATGVNQNDFISGSRSGLYGKKHFPGLNPEQNTDMTNARKIIWQELSHYKLNAVILEEARHIYLVVNLLPSDYLNTFLEIQNCLKTHDAKDETVYQSAVINSIVNCEIPHNCIILHSHIDNQIRFGSNTMISGINLRHMKLKEESFNIGSGIFLQSFLIYFKSLSVSEVLTVFGYSDDLMVSSDCIISFCNQPWKQFLDRTGINHLDLWDSDMPIDKCCLLNAGLFSLCEPEFQIHEILWFLDQSICDNNYLQRWRSRSRVSLEYIISCVNFEAEMHRRRVLYYERCQSHLQKILLQSQNVATLHYFQSAVADNYEEQLLETLDQVIIDVQSPGIAARTLANIADLLGCMAGKKGGLRSGPAGNKAWAEAFKKLEEDDIANGILMLKNERQYWIDRPDLLVRAARHYEGAAQLFIRKAVMTAKQFISTTSIPLPEINNWVNVECPARIDLSGGWTDTPPITYELGGAVVNAAILVDGKRPIGVRACRIQEPKIVLVIDNEIIGIHTLSGLLDYSNPQAPGALVKAAIICTAVIDTSSEESLQEQLLTKYGSGIELHTFSSLPQGSGLGTSSILAGAIAAALFRITGRATDIDSIIHAVLCIEQLLTTGGGWQDQVGGLMGGIKLGLCKAQLPVHVKVESIDCSEEVIKSLNSHLVLIYTGRVRLAKNLLQNVIRNWYARDSTIVVNCSSMVTNALQCAEAIKNGNLEAFGLCLNTYWEQKKIMAPGCEPVAVHQIMTQLRPFVYGQLLAGAGGGGFLYVLTKQPNIHATISQALKSLADTRKFSIHSVIIDKIGMLITEEENI